MVVIGNGSSPESELRIDNVTSDKVRVYRRITGGCSVVLTRDMVVCAFALYGMGLRDLIGYFSYFNAIVIDALASLGVRDLKHRGTSDIASDNRKIAGTALYRNKFITFYHAVVNVRGDVALIDRYLTQPPRMPEYRESRRHREFVTSIENLGFTFSNSEFESAILKSWENRVDLEAGTSRSVNQ
jgi:lipoate-protein ligase A